jgi:hypothetical protein
MKKPKSNNNLATFQKYFKGIPPISLMYDLEKVEIRKADLEELLSDYGLSKHFLFFEELSKWIPPYQDLIFHNKEYWKEIELSHLEELSLIHLSESMKNNQIESIEIKFTAKDKTKGNFELKIPDLLEEIGEMLYFHFVEERIQQGISSNEVIFSKGETKKGKPNSTFFQALISFGLLQYLNNETELKSGSNFISNDQGKFIYDFLEYSNFLPVESSKVLQEEYIRTLLNNYKGKESFPPFK